MSNSAMPNLPGFGAIAESMELVRKMWGGTASPGIGFPGMTTPSMSVEEINKQIADLKAVEAWLTLNMNMLRGTIQALEVQSATISAMKSMGEAFKNAGKASAAVAQPASGFSFPFGYPAPPQGPQSSAVQSPLQAGATEPIGTDVGASFADPMTWWNMLQGQFKQAVTAAAGQTDSHGNAAAGQTDSHGNAAAGTVANDALSPLVADPVASEGAAPAASNAPAAQKTPQPDSTSKRSAKTAGKPPAQ